MVGTDPEGQGGVAAVVAAYKRGGLFSREDIQYVCTHRGGSLFGKLTCAVTGALHLAALLIFGRVSLVHAHVSSHGSFKRKAIYLAFARWRGVPTIFHLHSGGFRKFVDEEASPGLRRRIVQTLQSSSHLVALSDSWATYLHSLAPGVTVSVLPNPVDVLPDAALRDGEPGRLLFLGRASDSKGVYDLLDAFAALVQRHPHARLAVGGDGDLQRLRNRIAELGLGMHVEVLGWVSGQQKLDQFLRCQVYVLPSYHEGMPVGMLEAMALARAVVVTPVGGVPEAVQDGTHGLLVTPGDVVALTAALSRLLDDVGLQRKLGQAARAQVASNYATGLVLARIASMYEKVLRAPGAPL